MSEKLCICLGLALALCACSKEAPPETESDNASTAAIPSAAPRATSTTKRTQHSSRHDPRKKRVATAESIAVSPADAALLASLEEAVDGENVAKLRALIPAALASSSADVRSEVVDAIASFGEQTMDDLLPFMADADNDIAENAMTHWTTSLNEISDEGRKCVLVESVMKVLTNEETLESLIMEVNDCDTLTLLRSVINLIECPNPVAKKVALEHYEFMTGEPFTTMDAVHAWIEENCVDTKED